MSSNKQFIRRLANNVKRKQCLMTQQSRTVQKVFNTTQDASTPHIQLYINSTNCTVRNEKWNIQRLILTKNITYNFVKIFYKN